MKRNALGLLVLMVAGPAAAACYQLYDATDRLIYRGERPPLPLGGGSPSAAVQTRFPGAHLVISEGRWCEALDLISAEGRARAAGREAIATARVRSLYSAAGPTAAELEPPPAPPAPAPAPNPPAEPLPARAASQPQTIAPEPQSQTVIYVPVAPHYGRRPPYYDSRPQPPVGPKDDCGQGNFAFCRDGRPAPNTSQFRYGSDGKLDSGR